MKGTVVDRVVAAKMTESRILMDGLSIMKPARRNSRVTERLPKREQAHGSLNR